MEIRRFGFGHRRAEGPPGSRGVTGALLHGDARGTITELAFGRKAILEPHTNPDTAWFVVIEGGGFVRVGEDTARVFAGEAVLWPAGILHGASTDLTEMRAIVVEFAGADDAAVQGILDGVALALEAGPVEPGEGALAGDPPGHAYDRSHGEPR